MTDTNTGNVIHGKEKKPTVFNLLEQRLLSFLHINKENRDDRNAYYMVVEIFWATFLGAATAFNAAYALRLGSSDEEVNFLTSIPALIAILVSIPAGRILQKAAHKKRLVMSSIALHRMGYLLIALVPWLKFLNLPQSTLVVVMLIVFTIPAQFFNIGFISIQAEIISEERRGAVFSMRNQVFSAVRAVAVFLLGLWLDAVVFPLNYQLMYLVTFLICLLSTWYLVKLEVPERKSAPAPAVDIPTRKQQKPLGQRIQETLGDLRQNPQFLRFTINTFVMDIGLWAIIPLFTIYFVNDLGATDAWLGTSNAAMSVANIIGFSIGKLIMQRFGRKKTLQYLSLLRPVYPLVVGLTGDLTAILVISTITGVIMPGMDLSHYSLLLTITPPDKREEYTALYSTILNVSVFVSPLIGTAIAAVLGAATTILIFAGVRLIGALMWTIFPIKDFDRAAVMQAD
ncbi:MAG: MFS transporter [Anaerolineae bacterium]|nr:MFS transporter [Anaerolineae bacterium]